MPMRIFLANDGTPWTVWLVSTGSAGAVPGTPTEWLAFQSEDGTERRRLMEVPPHWEDLVDERLDLLRRMATPAPLLSQRHSPPPGTIKREDAESSSEPER